MSHDPFYLARQEIQESINELHTRMSRFHGLTAANPERKQIARSVTDGCESIKWQLTELNNAMDRAAQDPQRFGLPQEEIASRRKWINNARKQVDSMLDTLKTATATPVNPVESKIHAANESFLGDSQQKQQLLVKQQDAHLEDIEQAVTRLGRVGLTIHEELESQGRMLDELDEDVDTTHSRLKATQKKVLDVIKRSSSNTQLALIVFLIIVLIVLAVFAFI